MDWKEILDVIVVILGCCVFIVMIIHFILDIEQSNKYWKHMYARMDLFEASLKKEHELLNKVQAFDEWLDGYCGIMHTNASLEDNEFNNGVANAANDIQESFLNYLGEYVDGKESSD